MEFKITPVPVGRDLLNGRTGGHQGLYTYSRFPSCNVYFHFRFHTLYKGALIVFHRYGMQFIPYDLKITFKNYKGHGNN